MEDKFMKDEMLKQSECNHTHTHTHTHTHNKHWISDLLDKIKLPFFSEKANLRKVFFLSFSSEKVSWVSDLLDKIKLPFFSEKTEFKKSLFGYFFSRKSNAFTLAEVLITLGIIGVVAALCIPTLISSYRKQVVETRLKGFYSEMNQAIKLSTLDNGNTDTWDYPSGSNWTEAETFFNKYLAKYIKYVKTDNDAYNNYNYSHGIKVYLANGSAFLVTKSGHSCINDTNLWLTFYPDATKTNTDGKNTFTFTIPNSPINSISTTDDWVKSQSEINGLKNHSHWGCNTSVGIGCTTIIRLNNWQIPDDYPFNF